MAFFESLSRSIYFVQHDLFRKPVPRLFGIMLQHKRALSSTTSQAAAGAAQWLP
jgi:hypothetical protein